MRKPSEAGLLTTLLPSLKHIAPENGWLEFGILISFWDGLFSGAMLVSGSVTFINCKKGNCCIRFVMIFTDLWMGHDGLLLSKMH